MPELLHFQTDFAAALRERRSTSAMQRWLAGSDDLVDRRMAIYRANMVAAADKALSSAYPVIRQVVGEEFFHGLAREYQHGTPSASGDLTDFGATFDGFLAAFEPTVHQGAVDKTAGAQGSGNQKQRHHDDAPWDVFGANEIEGSGQQQAGGKAYLHGEALLMQEGTQAGGRVEMQPAAGNDQGCSESAKQGEQDPHGTSVKERSVVEGTRSHDGAGVALVDGGNDSRDEDSQDVKEHPKLDFAL